MVSFTVYGKPQPAGSKRAFPIKGSTRFVVTDANKNAKPWQAEVKAAARAVCDAPTLLTGAIRFVAHFYFTRPKSHFGSGKKSNVLKPSAPIHHLQKPDVLKLARGVEDALTGVLWRDDCLIVDERLTKEWTMGSSRAEVEITSVEEPHAVVSTQQAGFTGGV